MSARRRTPDPGTLPRDPEPGATASPGAPDARTATIRGWWSLAAALLASLLLALHGRYLLWPFVSDDLVFADASRSFSQLFSTFHQYSNYFRPVGRELYFFAGHALAGNHPLPYHVVNFLVLLGIVLLVVALAWRLAGPRAGLLAGTAYALLYSHRLVLAWVSCSQDLLAALFAMLAVHALISGHRGRAAAMHLVAMLAKESVAALPVVVALWAMLDAPTGTPLRRRALAGLRTSAPLWAATAAWAVTVLGARTLWHAWARGGSTPLADVTLSVGSLWEGMRSALLTYVALEQPWDAIARAFAGVGPGLALAEALAVILALALWSRRLAPPSPRGGAPDRVTSLGALWATLGAVPVALAGHHYSAYYVTFSGVGFALLLGRWLAPAPTALAFAVFAASAVTGEAANRVDLFNFARMEPEPGVSFITLGRFEHEIRFLDSLQVAMDRIPPARGSMVYLSHAPHYTSFVTIRGACARVWFEDPGIELGSIGDYRGPGARPHVFLRFDPANHGFVHVPNEVMDADLAAEQALEQHRPGDARAAIDRALALLPATGTNVVRLDLLNNRGFACASLGDTSAARDAWRSALAIDSSFASAALNLARLDAPAGRLADARATLERLLVHAPADGEALSLLVRVQRVQGDVVAAEATLERLAEVDPERAAGLE